MPTPSPAASSVATLVARSVPDAWPAPSTLRIAEHLRASALAPNVGLLRALARDAPVPAVVAIGAFDGVHVGHQALVRAACSDAAQRGLPCVAVTFDPDPSDVLVAPPVRTRLLEVADRARALLAVGVDAVVTIDFTSELANLDYRRFLLGRLLTRLRAAAIHVGSDFRMGRGGAGGVGELAALGMQAGFALRAHSLVVADGAPVSSTRVRGLLAAGDVDGATRLLGRLPVVRGRVEHGRGEGTSLGFPTANVRCDAATCMPAAGVYAAYVVLASGAAPWPPLAYAAALNVGAPPTFTNADDPSFLEACLLGFEGDLYDRSLAVAFCAKIRPARRFDSLHDLKAAVNENIHWVECNLGSHPLRLAEGTGAGG